MKKSNFLICFLSLSFFLASCSKKKPAEPDAIDTGNFVSAKSVGTFSSTQLKSFASLGGYSDAAPFLQYGVKYVKIIYKTTYKGSEIEASGLLAIPQNMPKNPSVVSAQHGSIFLASAAPSNFPGSGSFTGFELVASTGFITAIPDYIGYGSSKNITHPYYDTEHSALAVTDMLKAVSVYLKQEKIAHTDRLFLMGYSEGGYVTMAAQKAIEGTSIDGFSLKASAEGAGGYDLISMLNTITTSEVYHDPGYLALILNAYNVTNGWNRPLTDFFKEPYAGRIPNLLNGTLDAAAINAQLTTNPVALLNASFYASLQNPELEKPLKAALISNSFTNWVPKTATRLYHGTADETVFYSSSQATYQRFVSSGATQVTLIPIPGGTHTTTVVPMMLDVVAWFQLLDK